MHNLSKQHQLMLLILILLTGWMGWQVSMAWTPVKREISTLRQIQTLPSDWPVQAEIYLLNQELARVVKGRDSGSVNQMLALLSPYMGAQAVAWPGSSQSAAVLQHISTSTPEVSSWVKDGANLSALRNLNLHQDSLAQVHSLVASLKRILDAELIDFGSKMTTLGLQDPQDWNDILNLLYRESRLEHEHMPGRLLACVMAPELVSPQSEHSWLSCLRAKAGASTSRMILR